MQGLWRPLLDPLRRHWRAALYNGLILGWWLAGPTGPLMQGLAGERAGTYTAWGMAGVGTGLVLGGLASDWRPGWKRPASTLSLGVVAATSILVPDLPAGAMKPLLIVLGLALGLWVAMWGCLFVLHVPPGERGRVFGWAAATVYLVVQAVHWLAPWVSEHLLWGGLSALLVVTMAIPAGSSIPSQARGRSPAQSLAAVRAELLPWWRLVAFAVLAHLLAGSIWQASNTNLQATAQGLPPPLVLASATGALAAGLMADGKGRLPLGMGSVLVMSLAVGLGLAVPAPAGPWLQDATFRLGFAMLEVFWWVSLADLAGAPHPSSTYGIGHVGPALAATLSVLLQPLLQGTGALGIAVLILAASAGVLWGLTEPRPRSLMAMALASLPAAVPPPGTVDEPGQAASGVSAVSPAGGEALADTGPATQTEAAQTEESLVQAVQNIASPPLTPREQEVLPFLLQGLELDQIASRLFITRNTLRTHLRNIYRKTGTRNRSDLLAVLLDRVTGRDSS